MAENPYKRPPLEGQEKVAAQYVILKKQTGRAPTIEELMRGTGLSSWKVKLRLERLNLNYTRTRSIQSQDKKALSAIRPEPEKETAEMIRRQRLNVLQEMPGSGPRNMRAGSEYAPGQVIKGSCAMCGRALHFRPSEWGHYMRRKDGSIMWLCAACDGQSAPGAGKTYMKER